MMRGTTSSVLPAWVWSLKNRIPGLLTSLRARSCGQYRLCAEGDILTPSSGAGLGFSCYAAKVTIQCGLWGSLSAKERSEWTCHIQGFQLPPCADSGGLFLDPWVERHQARRHPRHRAKLLLTGRWTELVGTFGPDRNLRIAETRQAISTLIAMGARPRYPLSGLPCVVKAVRGYLSRLDWTRPWGAGAQAGHLLFLLRHSELDQHDRDAGLQAALDFLGEIECPERGGWHRGDVLAEDILNGAMKVMSGLAWWDLPVRHAAPLLETALGAVDTDYDCGHTNRLFVLHRLARQMELPQARVESALTSALRSAQSFLRADGGFSTTHAGSLIDYYGTRVSEGRPVSDLHGLCLLTWAIALAASLAGELDCLGWRLIAP